MRLFHRRRSYYPLVVALLTLALGIFAYAALAPRAPVPAEVPAVSEAGYREAARGVVAAFRGSSAAASDEIGRRVAAEVALRDLTELTVPVAYKSFHLGLAVAFALAREGEGTDRLDKIVAENPWVTE